MSSCLRTPTSRCTGPLARAIRVSSPTELTRAEDSPPSGKAATPPLDAAPASSREAWRIAWSLTRLGDAYAGAVASGAAQSRIASTALRIDLIVVG